MAPPPPPAADPVVARTEAFLREHYPQCVLIPTKSNDPAAPASASKQPRWPHAKVATDALWKEWERCGRANCAKGAVIILRAGLIVLDFDDVDLADVFVAGCPAMATTAIQETAKGRHYFFRRTPACDAARLYDKARCLTLADGEDMPVDIKTVCATGTGGAISVCPSPGKRWLRPPYEHPPIDLPDSLLTVIVACHKDLGRRDHTSRASTSAASTASPYSASEPYPAASRDQVRALLMECVDAKRADDYDDWLRVGMALRNEHPSLLGVWEEFSRRCAAKFDKNVDACEGKWATFGRLLGACRRVTLGTIHAWAKADNPGRYAAITGRAPEAVLRWDLPMPPPSPPPPEPIADDADDDAISLASATSSQLTATSSSEMTRALKLSTTYDWLARPTPDGNIRLTAPKCRECLVKPGVRHDDAGTDSVFIKPALRGNKRMCLVCGCAGVMTHPSAQVVNAVLAMLQQMGVVERPPETLTEFETLRDHMLDVARQHRYMKVAAARRIYAPVPGCPCAYTPLEEVGEFGQFINHVFRDNALFHKTVKNYDELMAYLVKINPPHLPELKVDRGLLSFANGVLVLDRAQLVAHDAPEVQGRVARNHIPCEYTGSHDTPLVDLILAHQFGHQPRVIDTLHVLLGRLLFRVRQHDNWQVVPLLVGEAGSGKSTLLNVVSALFDPASVGEIDCNNEKAFGLQDKYAKELLTVSDMPQRMSDHLPQEQFQKMVSGDHVQVSVKYGTAFSLKWDVPMLFAGNQLLDYKDDAGQTSRRVVPFYFRSGVGGATITTLEDDIKAAELPNLVAKCVSKYLTAAREHGHRRSFWDWCPDEMREAKDEALAEANHLYRFLTADPEETSSRSTRVVVRQVQGAVTAWTDFKAAFQAYMRFKHPSVKYEPPSTSNASVFQRLGYQVKHVHVCKACGAEGGSCCEQYTRANRVKLWRIYDMELTRTAVGADGLWALGE